MPEIRPFRALRYDPEVVGDLRKVVAPPYDCITPGLHHELLERHPRNVVRLDLPHAEPGDEPDDRYRRAARTFAAWRSDGTFHKDRRPSLYAYEQTSLVPGSTVERVQRGFFGRLRLEPYGPGSGVRPHEHTLSAPREDRYRLLRATGANMSPVTGLYADPGRVSADALEDVARTPPDVDLVDDDGTRHRLWAVPDEGSTAPVVDVLLGAAQSGPITVADGHHRYETALRYRDERRMTRSCEEDPAFDYVLMLFLHTAQPLTVLPTHRVVMDADPGAVDALAGGAGALFSAVPADRDELARRFDVATIAEGGHGRFGLWTGRRGALLEADRAAFEPILPAGSEAVRRLDVTLLQAALSSLLGVDAQAVAAGGLAYARSASDAIDLVDAVDVVDALEAAGERAPATGGRARAAFLLEPTPVQSILDVAAAGDVMPPKSTYFYPKALSGLLINPLEW